MFRLLPAMLGGTVLIAAACCADVIVLESGARFYGSAPPDGARATVTIELEEGGRLTVPRSDVARIDPESEAEREYRRRAPTVPDTAEAQWALAQWCRQRRLGAAHRRHLERVVALDPHHAEARALLGFREHDGQWMTREDLMAARGMIRHEGEYRTRQEIAILERLEKNKKQQADWAGQLRRWRRKLSDRNPQQAAEAAANFASLEDRSAAPVVAEMLLEEQDPIAKALLIEAAARLEHGATVRVLAALALDDVNEEVRYVCLEHLAKAQTPGLIEPFVRALESKDNGRVNRAAAALQELAAKDALPELIDSLVTEHQFKVGEASSGGQQHSYTMGNGGFSFGGGGPKVIKRQLKNPKVLGAAVALSGANFGYDEVRWKAWLASRAAQTVVNLRRDP